MSGYLLLGAFALLSAVEFHFGHHVSGVAAGAFSLFLLVVAMCGGLI